MQCDFDIFYERKNTCCIKWDCTRDVFNEDDVLPMWIADMDFRAPLEVKEAIDKRNKHGIYGYTESMPASYCEAVIDWLNKRHKWSIRKEWLCSTPGVVSALGFSVMAFTKPGGKVIIQTPVYSPFYDVIEKNGRQIIENPLVLQNGRYTMDFADLESKMKSGAKMMILCSPHNPVGRVWSREELSRLGELCLENNVLLVSDEIHSDITYGNYRHIPAASISEGIAQNTITCIAASKTFNIAGLSTSTVIIPDDDIRKLFTSKLHGVGIHGCNIFGIIATEAAYRYGEKWLEQLLDYLAGNLKYIIDYFKMYIPEIKVIKPEGSYLVWLDCRSLGLSSDELSDLMVHKARIGLNNGASFGTEGEGFLRMNFACPRSVLKEGMKRIRNALDFVR